MAKHIMAVCVVCLLCADHLPCQQHVDNVFSTSMQAPMNLAINDQYKLDTFSLHHQPESVEQAHEQKLKLNAKVFQRTDLPINPSIESTTAEQTFYYKNNPSDTIYSNGVNDNDEYAQDEQRPQYEHFHQKDTRSRRKRHADHDWEESQSHQPEITELFLRLIFKDFGEPNGGTINASEFQNILRQLGLNKLVEHNLSTDKDSCISDMRLVQHVQPHDHHREPNHYHPPQQYSTKVNCSILLNGTMPHPQCIYTTDKEGSKSIPYEKFNYTLTSEDVLNICPILLYQLISPFETLRTGCIDNVVLTDIGNYEAAKINADKEDMFYVWVYAFTSVFACSILGLVGVAIIPFMDSRYYKHIIQFLVSLAVGTMTGDALLHLVPHSLAGQSERNMIFKGLTCMGGIIFFYVTEHGLTMISEWRKTVAKRETVKPSRAKVVRDPDSSMTNSVAGDKLCKSKYSSYPYCYDEIAMDTKNDIHLPVKRKLLLNNKDGGELQDGHIPSAEHKHNGLAELDASEAAAQSLLSTSQNNYTPINDLNRHHNLHHHNHHEQQQLQSQPQVHLPDSHTISTDLDGNSVGDPINGTVDAVKDKTSEGGETVTVILREHESSHHGHSHKHGHVHSPPESLSAVAWMIIMGDGLHNFTDGMAIGAAFAENVAGGFSTSLAVFCHELPHELGDFAILLKAGMSVRSAVFYNLLTGLLSFLGMIFGIVFGQSQDTAQWMFAAAAGLFIYIALVDMMPELSASHKTIEQFILQILGMSSGVFFMLLIALYEGDLMNVFSTSSGQQH